MIIECYRICTRIIILIFVWRNENLNKNRTIKVLLLFTITHLPVAKSILRLEVF